MGFFGPRYKAEYPLNWSFVGTGNGSTRAYSGVRSLLNFYDPVFIGTIATNGALDTTTNLTADITFSPSVNMASLLNQTAIVASSTTVNDYGYIPYIVEVDGYMPLFLNMNDTITANTTKVVVRSGTGTQDGSDGLTTKILTSNELANKNCYLRRVICLYELTTRPTGLNLDNSSFTANNSVSLADQFFYFAGGTTITLFLRGDGITWRSSGGTQNRGNLPFFFMNYGFCLNAIKLSTNKTIQYP